MGGLRLRGLSQLDPLAVPLPHGTEVTTRVDRLVGDRRVPHWAVGRIVARDGDELEVRGPMREQLLAIKRGAVPLEEVLRMAEALTPELEDARQGTSLPRHPDVGRIDTLLRRVRAEAARRWLAAEPGPFGQDAPEPPLAAWEET